MVFVRVCVVVAVRCYWQRWRHPLWRLVAHGNSWRCRWSKQASSVKLICRQSWQGCVVTDFILHHHHHHGYFHFVQDCQARKLNRRSCCDHRLVYRGFSQEYQSCGNLIQAANIINQEVDQRGHGKRFCEKIAKPVIWTGKMLWIMVDGRSW